MFASTAALCLGIYLLLDAACAQNLPRLSPRQLAVNQLVNASRIMATLGIADDSPGHISLRDPLSPDEFFLVTGGEGTPAQVTPADIAVVRINDSVVTGAALGGFAAPVRPAEVFIHSSLYQRFRNTTVNSVAYYRAEQLLPWSIYPSGVSTATVSDSNANITSFLPAFQGAAFMGPHAAPIFNVFDSNPNTTTVAVDNTIKGFALAQRFGPTNAEVSTVNETDGFRPLVLMRNDGATVVGTTVPEVVFRYVQAAKNARILYHMEASSASGSSATAPQFLPAGATQTTDNYLRSWLLWMTQIETEMVAEQRRSPEKWVSSGESTSDSNGAASNALGFHRAMAPSVIGTVLMLFAYWILI